MLTTLPPPHAEKDLQTWGKTSIWGEGEQAKLRQNVLLLNVLLAGVLFVFLMANTLSTNMDTVYFFHRHPETGEGWVAAQARNLRFFSAGLGWVLERLGVEHLYLFGLWALLFTASIWLLGHQVARTLGLGFFASAWTGAAVAVHGFMAELYSFPTAYVVYAAGMAGAALLLYALPLFPQAPRLAGFLGALGAFMCLGSYQPLILVPAFAFGLRVFYRNLTEDRPYLPWRDAFFLAGCVAFAGLATFAGMVLRDKGLPAGPVGDRLLPGTFANNWWPYLKTIIEIYFPSKVQYYYLFPAYERLFYFAATSALVILPLHLLARARDGEERKRGLIALAAALGLLFMVPGVFNLIIIAYWPTARSMISVVFFHAALVALLAHLALGSRLFARLAGRVPNWPKSILWLIIGFVILSSANQASVWFARALQTRADLQAASAIVATLRSKTQLDANSVVAVRSTWQNFAQQPAAFLDYNLSAFSQPWSSVPLLRLASGVPLREVPPPPGACDGFRGSTYEVRQINGIWVVCMN